MSETLSLAGSDRLLIIAPHPDDESIAAGGLLQVARASGAALRVLVLTDGDNNPWPQRWVEKQWRIDAAARARWGARRRDEGEAALRILGVPRDDVRFLELPDGGITDILMRDDRDVADMLRDQARDFAPTLLVAPALSDRHPDHSAAFILATRATTEAGFDFARILTFAVHGAAPQAGGVVVELNEQQRRIKYEAIRAHATQMRLSGKRFLKFAQPHESYRWFTRPARPDPQIPIRATVADGVLTVRVDSAQRGLDLFVCAQDVREQLPLREDGSRVSRDGHRLVVTLPFSGGVREGFVKVARAKPGLWVFDRFGWQPIG